ncbi:tyrosine-protein phosphatase non-receptor type 21 [Eurosta solidaginis]|uniref:tyrosine-protein phosphatase non-receptor type 21 n=1 Tax=Eurosta solidaginis TaxID=178769 RepID=UPI003530C7AF
MPLKFLKKCRQYNVTSKSLFVISVHHLLDTSTTVDCTISSESKGQECLDNVCQRLNLQEPEFFGLRYVVKGKEDELKWIDLERSLSRQLEKYAASTKIYLRVRHYVDPPRRDDLTRYYYFLQLKSDIYEGKIICDIRTAILLALYCRQAEYDSHQNDKQTKDYLKKSLVLPRNLQGLANDDNLLDSLIMEVLQQNAGIQNLQQSQAEEMYIQCCQQLDGYGEERFHAKDTLGNDLLLGLAINGMVVMADNGRQYFPWKESQTVSIDKRTIKIEQNKTDGSIVGSFLFSDAETARYFWKLCITQHKFFKRYIDEEAASSMGDAESANGNSIGVSGGVSTVGGSVLAGGMETYAYGDFNDSREDLLLEQQQRAIYNPNAITSGGGGLANINPEFMSAPALHHGLLASNHASNALMSSNISLAASHQSGGGVGGAVGGGGPNGGMHSHSVGAIAPSWLTKEYGHDYTSTQHLSNSMLDTRLQQSSSCLDLTNNNSNNIGGSNFHSSSNNIVHGHLNGSVINNGSNAALHSVDAHERERLKAMLPTYRPAPDYETAVQLKYRAPSSELHQPQMSNYANYQPQTAVPIGATPSASGAMYYAGSQPDVHNAATIYGDGVLLSQLEPHRYPDVAQPAAAAMHAQHHLTAAGVAMAPGGHSNSTSSGGGAYIDLGHRLQMIRSKPPPPYPVNRLNSSSTPDLAVATHRPLMGYRAYVSGSSPDLVSNRNLLNSHYPYGSSVGANIGNAAQTAGSMVAATNHALIHPHHSSSYMNSAGIMGHSQSYLPHGTFENLNMIEEQPSIMSQLRQECLFVPHNSHSYNDQHSPTLANNTNANSNNSNNIYHPTPPQQVQSQQSQSPQQLQTHSQQQQLQHSQTSTASLQRNTLNGSIEPIYENVPHARYVAAEPTVQRSVENRSSGSSATSEAMRNRTASIQSAPGGMNGQTPQQLPPVPAARHHHLQQQQQQEQQQAQQQALQQQQQQTLFQQKQQAHVQAQQQQQAHAQQQAEADEAANAADLNMHKYFERSASTELQFLEPMPPQRAARAASAAPSVGHNNSNNTSNQETMKQTPPPRHHHPHAQKAQLIQTTSSASTVDVAATSISNTTPKSNIGVRARTTPPERDSTDAVLQQKFSAMNISTLSSNTSVSAATTLEHSSPHHQNHQYHRSHNVSMLDTTANSSSTTTTNSFNTTNSSSTSGKEGKRKKIWNILGRSKTPDKQKSATLGREKASSSSAAKAAAKIKLAQDDLNLMHRWSTGVPRLQPISGQYSKDKLCPILNEKLNDPQLFMEFESIPKRREMARYVCALMEENAMKNSDPNFLPYDDNRVCITPTMENRTGYVNASRISATVGTKQRFYIIAQSPQEELTTRIFWQCVWEADVYLIVQLSEGLNYMPPSSNQRLEFGQFQVYQEFSQTTDRCITSKLRLFHIQSRRYRSVWHLNYTNWGEQNCPREVNHFLDFLEELNSVRMASINEVPPGHNTNPPVLIHCLEGGGRSGVTLTADLLLYTLDHNEDLDIPRVIGQLRHQRDSIIPSLAQYKFIYSLLITYLKRTRLI